MPGSNVADYRLRLFLSVDLANSTVFKFREGNRPAASEISSGHTSTRPRWLVVTTKFYSDFTAVLISRFNALRAAMEIKCDFEPKIWKTIGDEIVFAMTVKTSDEI